MVNVIHRFFGTLYKLNLVKGKYADLENGIFSLGDVEERLREYVGKQ